MDYDVDNVVDPATAERLRSFISRLENLEEEKKEVLNNMKEVLDEAKSEGFDAKIIRKVITLRKLKPSERQEIEALTETYLNAIEETA